MDRCTSAAVLLRSMASGLVMRDSAAAGGGRCDSTNAPIFLEMPPICAPNARGFRHTSASVGERSEGFYRVRVVHFVNAGEHSRALQWRPNLCGLYALTWFALDPSPKHDFSPAAFERAAYRRHDPPQLVPVKPKNAALTTLRVAARAA